MCICFGFLQHSIDLVSAGILSVFFFSVADENRGKYMMFSSEVNEVKALRKHLKNMDNMNTNTRKVIIINNTS